MLFSLLAASLLSLQTASAAQDQQDASNSGASETGTMVVEGKRPKEAAKEKPKKITDRSHPDFVRCRSEAVIGSRARRKRTCMTNSEWDRVAREGNRQSRELLNDNQPGFMPQP